MDPISAMILAVVAGWFAVSDRFQRTRAALRGRTAEYEARRAEDRQREHELRLAKLTRWHEQRMAGVAGPTVSEAVAARIRDWHRSSREEMGPLRGYAHDWLQETVDRIAVRRRGRQHRSEQGDLWWQRLTSRLRDAYDRAGQRAEEAWDRRERRRFEAGTQDWPEPPPEPDRSERPPHSGGKGGKAWQCRRCGERTAFSDGLCGRCIVETGPTPEGHRPAPPPPTSDPDEEPAPERWDAERLDRSEPDPEPGGWDDETLPVVDSVVDGEVIDTDDRAGPVPADPTPVPELPDGRPAAPQHTQGASMGEIVNPETAAADAELLRTEANGLVAALDQRLAELDARGVSGGPRDCYVSMQEAATLLCDAATEAAGYFAGHQQIHDVVHSDDTVGDGDYLEVNR